MAIGTPFSLGVTAGAVASNGMSGTSTVDAPAGTLIVIPINLGNNFTQTVSSVTDSAGNTYNRSQPAGSGSTINACIAWVITNVDVPIGTTWTVQSSGGGTMQFKSPYGVSGAAGGVDIVVSNNNGSSNTGVTLTTGALNGTNEIAFGYAVPQGGTVTPDGTFTDLFNNTFNDFAYLIQNGSSASITWHPTWTSVPNTSAVLVTFKITAVANLPIVVGINTTINSNTLVTTADIPANSLVVVTLGPASGNFVVSTLTDGHGNTYTRAVANSGALFPIEFWYCSGTPNDIPSGSTFTATGTDPAHTLVLSIVYVQGYNGGLDRTNSLQTSTSVTTFSLATGSLSQAAEIVFGAWQAYNTTTSYTEGSGFTNLVNEVTANVGNSYEVTSATTSVAWAPSWAPGLQASAIIASFEATPFPVTWGFETPALISPRRRSLFAATLRPDVFIDVPTPTSGFSIIRSNNENFGPPIDAASKYYFEVTVTSASILGQVGVGIDNGVESTHGQASPGAICWCGDGSVNYNGNLSVYNAGPFSVGNILGVAVDYTTGLIWFRAGTGNWNNSPTANPATGIGGFLWSGIAIGGVLQAFAIQQLSAGAVLTPNYMGMNATPFVNGPPTGFSPWQGFTNFGWQEVETFPVRNVASRFNALIGKCQFAIPSQQGFSAPGWAPELTSPSRNMQSRSSAAYGESVFAIPQGPKFVPDGWEAVFTQPPHPRPEKAGAILRGDEGIQAKFVNVAFIPNFGSYATTWSDPPHRAPEKKFGAIAPFDDTSYLPATRLLFYGWEVLPWQPPHRRSEKWGSIAPWDILIASAFAAPLVTLGPGFEVQPWQPPHLRIETRGVALIIGDSGIYKPFVFVPPPPPPPPPPPGGSGDLPIGLLPDYIPHPAYDKKPNKPLRPIWDRKKAPDPEPAPSGPPPLPPLDVFGVKAPARILDVHGLPTFQEYVPENPLAMHQRMQEALDESDALAALRAMGLLKDK